MEVSRVEHEQFGKGEPISDASQVSPSWLEKVLQRRGAFQHVKVSNVKTSTMRSTLFSQLAFLTVDYAKGTEPDAPRRLLLKISNPDSDNADRSGSPNVYTEMGRKEVLFNNVIAPKINPSALVPCYDAVYSVETERFHILMADLTETHFQTEWPLPPLKRHCKMVIDAIADVHAACWEDQQLYQVIGMPEIERRIQDVQSSIPPFLDFLGDRMSIERRKIYEQMSTAASNVFTKRFAGGRGLTLIHADAHFWNALLPNDADNDTVRIIDWATYEINLPAVDLAYMIALNWFPERRKRLESDLLKRYYERLVAGGVSGYAWDDFWYDYRLRVLFNILNPIYQWQNRLPAQIWWPRLELSMLSYEELACAELLRS